MAKKKTTIYLDEELLRAAKIAAVREGKREYEVVEEALRRYLGFDVLERVWQTARLDEDAALRLAYRELHAARRASKR